MATWIVGPVLLIGIATGMWFLVNFIASKGASAVGGFTMALGAVGIAFSLLALIDYRGTKEMHVAALVAGAIIFGCGAIATVAAKNND
jgi:hypothetical protein